MHHLCSLVHICVKSLMEPDWKVGHIVKRPKKGDLTKCQNWWGIQLLSFPSKIFTRLILERIRSAVDSTLREKQAGFKAGKSCVDQIATLHIIIKQSIEWQSPLYVNFRKAFENPGALWYPSKVVIRVDSLLICRHHLLHHSQCRPDTGIRQGCILSPMTRWWRQCGSSVLGVKSRCPRDSSSLPCH